jgi:hypothetical protein
MVEFIKRSSRFRRAVVIVVAVAIIVSLTVVTTSLAVNRPAVVAHNAVPVQPVLRSHPRSINPHLHLPSDRSKEAPVSKRHSRSHWHHVWAFSDWATLHRGLGTIVGTVKGKDGQALTGIEVLLRTSHGKPFRSLAAKHITHTSEGGSFIMTRVRIGSYRVRAVRGKSSSHASVRVGAGRMANASIRL